MTTIALLYLNDKDLKEIYKIVSFIKVANFVKRVTDKIAKLAIMTKNKLPKL